MRKQNTYYDYEGIYMMNVNNEGIYFTQDELGFFHLSKKTYEVEGKPWKLIPVYRTAMSPYEKMLVDHLYGNEHSETQLVPVEDEAMKSFYYFAYNYNPETFDACPLYITDSQELVETQKQVMKDFRTPDGYEFRYQKVLTVEPITADYDLGEAIDDLLADING